MSTLLPDKFKLAQYRLYLQALDDLHLAPFKGSALRGGFGYTSKRLACLQPSACDKRCQRGNACSYGYIFETRPPQNSEALRKINEIPRPFVIGSTDPRTFIAAGELLTFELTLVGRGIDHLPHFIGVFRELGKTGLGRGRGKYHLVKVDAITPFASQNAESIYHSKDERLRTTDLDVTGLSVKDYAATLPGDQITLSFLAPTRLKRKGKWMFDGPPFDVLIRTLLSRISSLSYFHCGEEMQADFRDLVDRAAKVTIASSDTHWEDWERFSGRQKQRIKMGGLMGQVTYQGDLTPYLSLLALGELVHVGKGTVFGNGQYQIIQENA